MENTLSISEHAWNEGRTPDYEATERPDAASLAVGVVVEGARKGVVALCASVAHIIREKNKLEERLKELESQIYLGNNVVGSHSLSTTEPRSVPESPSPALRPQPCGPAMPICVVNSNIHMATDSKSKRNIHPERRTSAVNNEQKLNDCVCKKSNKNKRADNLVNCECAISNKKSKNSSSKINFSNTINCELGYTDRDFKICSEKSAKSSPRSEISCQFNLPINNSNAGLRTSRSYSGSHGTSPQFLNTPENGYGGNSGSFHRNSACWSTRSLNIGANDLPRGSFVRRKYNTISLRRVKRTSQSSKEEMHSSSSVGLGQSSVSSSRGSSFDIGSRRCSDLNNTPSDANKKVGGTVPSQQQQQQQWSGDSFTTNRSISSRSNSSRSCILTVAEVHHEPETNNPGHINTEREAVKLLARTLTTILRDQGESPELGGDISTASNYVPHNTTENSHLDYSKHSITSTTSDSSKITLNLNQKDSLPSYSTSEIDDDIKNQDFDTTFDVPSRGSTNTFSKTPEHFEISSDAQSRVSDTFEVSYGQDSIDVTDDNLSTNQDIKAPFPLAGCECPVCERLSSNPNAKLFALTTDEGFLLPSGSAVLVHGDYVGTVLYMGHQRTTVAGMLLHHSSYCSHSSSVTQDVETCADTCEITDDNLNAFATQLAPIGVMCRLWNKERQETFVPLSAVICQLDEDTLINSQNSSCSMKLSSQVSMSEYEDVEDSGDEGNSYSSYEYTVPRSQSLTNGDNYSLVTSERSSDIREEEEENIEDTKEVIDNNHGIVDDVHSTTNTVFYEKSNQSKVYSSSGDDISQRSFLDNQENKLVQDDTQSIDRLSLFGLDYQDDDPDFTNHSESDVSLNEEFCLHNSVCAPGFHEYHNGNYLLTNSTDIRKMSNSVRVTISPTDSSKSQSLNTFDYPHSPQLNTTYLKEPTNHSISNETSSDEKMESFESIDENALDSIKGHTSYTKLKQHSLYDTCDSAISLSFVRRFSGRNAYGTSEPSGSSSLQESGRESGSLGDTWGSSALSYPRYRSDSSGNVSDIEMNHLSSTFTKDLASALNSVLKKTEKEKNIIGENLEYGQEFGKERSYEYNERLPYNGSISKSQINLGSNAWKALDNRYQGDSEV